MSLSFQMADINLDGIMDLVGMENFFPTFFPLLPVRFRHGVVPGDGAGGFKPAQTILSPQGYLHQGMVLADVDGDGDQDSVLIEQVSAALGVFRNRARFGSSCSGAGRGSAQIEASSSFLGESSFNIRLTGAPQNSPALLGLSLARSPTVGSCQVLVDFSPANLILPLGNWGLTTTGSSGNAVVSIAIPNDPALSGVSVFAQWGVLDSAAPGGVALTQGAEMIVW